MTNTTYCILRCLIVALVFASAPLGAAPPEKEIAAELVCKCGCGNMPIADCECSNARRIRAEIHKKVAEGLSKREVLNYFMKKYGEDIMGAPPPWKGFNLVAWVLPFAALIGGGVFFVRWVGRSPRPSANASKDVSLGSGPAEVAADSPDLTERLDKELKEFE